MKIRATRLRRAARQAKVTLHLVEQGGVLWIGSRTPTRRAMRRLKGVAPRLRRLANDYARASRLRGVRWDSEYEGAASPPETW